MLLPSQDQFRQLFPIVESLPVLFGGLSGWLPFRFSEWKTRGKLPCPYCITYRHRDTYRHLCAFCVHLGMWDITIRVWKLCFIQGVMEHLQGIWDLENSSAIQGRPCYQGAQLSINVPQKLNRLLEQQLKHCGQWILRGWQNRWNPVITFYNRSAAW